MIRKTEIIFLLCSLLALGIIWAAAPLHAEDMDIKEGEVLTLDRAVDVAFKNNPSIDAQAFQLRANEAKIDQSRAGYYPQINLSAGYSRIAPVKTEQAGAAAGTAVPTGLNGRFDQYNQYVTNASLNQLLFDFGRTGAQVNVQKFTAEANRFQLQNTKDQIMFNVKQAYYTLLGMQHAVTVATETVENFKNHLNIAKSYYRAGMKPKFDVTKAEMDHTNAEIHLIKMENGARVARVNLNNAMGLFHKRVPMYLVEDDQAITPLELNLEKAVEIALEKRSDLKAMQKQKEAAKESVVVSRKGYYPTLSGIASYSYIAPEFPLDSGWYAGAHLVFPLFSGFLTKNQIKEAKANLEVVNANERALKQQIYLELEQAFIALVEASESRRKTELSIRQSKENWELAAQRYKSGIGAPEELSDAIVAYSNARLADITAIYEYKIARDRIIRSIGGGN